MAYSLHPFAPCIFRSPLGPRGVLTLIHMDLLHLPFLPLRHCHAPGPGWLPEVRVKDLPIVTF